METKNSCSKMESVAFQSRSRSGLLVSMRTVKFDIESAYSVHCFQKKGDIIWNVTSEFSSRTSLPTVFHEL